MSQQYPDTEDSPDAMDGNAAHEIGLSLIHDYARGNHRAYADDFNSKQATNGVMFTEEMFDAVKIYADDVAAVMRNTHIFGGKNMGIEQRVEIKCIHDIAFGTPDAWIYDHKNGRLYIWDFKFGHRIVEIFENWQLIMYLAGILDKLNIDGIKDQQLTIHMRVIQPRAFHRDGIIREWKTKASNLRGYFNILRSKAEEALGPNSVTHSGPHCRDCNARHACTAAIEGGINLYEVANKPTPVELSPIALGVQLSIIKRAIKQLEYLDVGMSAQIEGLIKSGKLIPGWQLESGASKKIWNKSTQEIITLGKLLNCNLSKSDQTITVKQAQNKGIDDNIIKEFSTMSQPGLTLVQDTGSKLKRLFL